jgi:hypothetical protein
MTVDTTIGSVGTLVCVSGQVTRAVCGIPVVSMCATFCDASGCTGNLEIAEDPLRVIGQGGDSGAPVYKNKPNGRAHSPVEIAGTAPTNVYFRKIWRMEAVLGMSVAHSA